MCSLLGHMKHVVASVREGSNVYIANKIYFLWHYRKHFVCTGGEVPPQLLEVYELFLVQHMILRSLIAP